MDTCPDLKAVGMDVPSLACIKYLEETMKSHNILLSGKNRKFIVIEDMNLEPDLAGLCEVRLNPWLVRSSKTVFPSRSGALVDGSMQVKIFPC